MRREKGSAIAICKEDQNEGFTMEFCKNDQVIIFQKVSSSQLAVGYEGVPPPVSGSIAIA